MCGLESEPAGAIFWDFDGTLAWRAGMWRSGLIAALDEVAPEHVLTVDDVAAGLRDGFPWHHFDEPHGHLDTAELWWEALQPVLIGAYVLAGLEEEQARVAAARVRATYLDPRYWTVFDDTRPALSRLRDAGWRHIVVSNHVPELAQLMEDLDLSDLFDDVLTSAVTGYEKPHPEMFALAIRRAGGLRRVWMVGDNPEADVAGAERAGIPAILVRTSPAPGRSPLDLHQAASIIIETRPPRTADPL